MKFKRNWIDTFFSEKDIANMSYVISHKGQTHILSTEVIKELIESTSDVEFEVIKKQLIKIDFLNGDVHNFLKSLAESYVKSNFW